jgi:hypothetical protein
MPLKKGKSKKVVSKNIRELMHTYEEKGKIGNVKPRSKAHAQKIAVAIALQQARKSGAKIPKKLRKKKF